MNLNTNASDLMNGVAASKTIGEEAAFFAYMASVLCVIQKAVNEQCLHTTIDVKVKGYAPRTVAVLEEMGFRTLQHHSVETYLNVYWGLSLYEQERVSAEADKLANATKEAAKKV